MRKFKTESQKLLDLMINSIYTNKDIFLRELISNASDAVDKLYFKSLTDTSLELSKDELAIRVLFDKKARTITVSDNGIGMDEEQLNVNLGTIAHSDSMTFKDENAEVQGEDVDIIGQFGVGFYSSFMVAKNVRVVSRALGAEQAWAWESDGTRGYDITQAERDTRGTDVILTLKDDTEEEDYSKYLNEYELKQLIKRYSNYVRYPVRMMVTKTREVPAPEDAPEDYTPEYESYTEEETINSMIPIWKRRGQEVTDEEYNEFYKSDFHDYADPLKRMTIHAEGALTYDALMFIPSQAPFDLYSKDYEKGLALYSSNVLIMEKCADLLPDYFNFVRGVVDSQDLSLNISRETLQQNSQLRAIAKKVEKKVSSELEKMRDNDRENYETFFENFGRGLKYGIYASYGAQKDTLADFLLFYSAAQEKMITLKEYVEGMPEDQKSIYYAAGESVDYLALMPIVKTVRSKGYDVLLCTQDVDEFCLQTMFMYDEKEFKNVSSGGIDFATEDEKQEAEQTTTSNSDLFKAMRDALGDEVEEVVVSARLSDAPSAITAKGPISLEMEKVFAMTPDAQEVKSQRVLEINANHPVFETLKSAFEAGQTDKVETYAKLLYNQALLIEGLPIKDPLAFAASISELMK